MFYCSSEFDVVFENHKSCLWSSWMILWTFCWILYLFLYCALNSEILAHAQKMCYHYNNKQINWKDTLCLEHLCRCECEVGWWIEKDTSKDRYTASQHTYITYECISCCYIVIMTQGGKIFYYCSCHWLTVSVLNLIFPLLFPLLDSGKVI